MLSLSVELFAWMFLSILPFAFMWFWALRLPRLPFVVRRRTLLAEDWGRASLHDFGAEEREYIRRQSLARMLLDEYTEETGKRPDAVDLYSRRDTIKL